MSDLNNIFRALDTDFSGYISEIELKEGLSRVGLDLRHEEIKNLISTIDKAGNGKIDYSEFLMAAIDRKHLLDRELMWMVFQTFDIDNSGYISVSNLTEVLKRAGWKFSH